MSKSIGVAGLLLMLVSHSTRAATATIRVAPSGLSCQNSCFEVNAAPAAHGVSPQTFTCVFFDPSPPGTTVTNVQVTRAMAKSFASTLLPSPTVQVAFNGQPIGTPLTISTVAICAGLTGITF